MEEDKRVLEKLKKKEKIYKMVIVIEIVIIIIALAVTFFVLYRNDDECSMYSEVEIKAFNGKFDQYVGEKIRGAQVMALINAVNVNNYSREDEGMQVFLEGDNIEKQGNTYSKKNILTGKSYNVEVTEYSEQGFIKRIKITEVGKE